MRISSRGRTIRPKVNFDSVPHQSVIDISETPVACRSHPNKGTPCASRNSFDRCGSEHECEDDAPLVNAIAEYSRADWSRSANHATASADKPASVKRVRSQRSHATPIQIENQTVEHRHSSSSVHPQPYHQPQGRHLFHDKQSISSREPAATDAALKTGVPLPELRNTSFIVTNVSRCFLCFYHSRTPHLQLCYNFLF